MVHSKLIVGDALTVIPTLPNRSVNVVVSSPPYAMQRHSHYGGIPETDFPRWLCDIMAALRPKLALDASVLMTIRTHLRDGVVSDYVLRTRLALREDGWKECEELIWYKPDAPPLGSKQRPRRTWENILWFSQTSKPYINLAGEMSDRIGFYGSKRFNNGDRKLVTVYKRKEDGGATDGLGRAKVTDTFTGSLTHIEHHFQHPAMYPVSLCERLISTFSREGDTVLDPFVGSGTTLVAAQNLRRHGIGIDTNADYLKMARVRLRKHLAADNHPVRLAKEFPDTPRGRKLYMLKQGFEQSDALVFEYIVGHTLFADTPAVEGQISLTAIETGTGKSRSTVQRSLNRLIEAGYVTRTPTKRHVGSTIRLTEAVVQS